MKGGRFIGFCDLPLAGSLCDDVAGGVGSAITDSIGNWIARSCGDLAQSAANLASKAVDTTTAVDLGASWFRANYAIILPIGLVALVATFCLQLLRAAWRRDGQALAQAVTGTVSGVLFSFTAVAGTTVALTVVDAVSAGLFKVANTSTSDAVSRLIKIGLIAGTAQFGWAVPALVALGCVAGAILYWGTMVLRKVALLVLVTLAVFAGAGGGWEPAARWRRAWIEATASLVFSKLIMTVVFLIGVSAIGNSDSSDGLTALSDILGGIVVMVLVMLCPMMTYRFIHWAGDGSSADLHRSTSAGLSTAAGAARRGATLAMRAKSGGLPAAAPQGPATVPGQGTPIGSSNVNPASPADGGTPPRFAYPGPTAGGGATVPGALVTRRTPDTRPPAGGQAHVPPGGASPGSAVAPATAAQAAGAGGAPVAGVLGARRSPVPAPVAVSPSEPAGPTANSATVSGSSPPVSGPPTPPTA